MPSKNDKKFRNILTTRVYQDKMQGNDEMSLKRETFVCISSLARARASYFFSFKN